MICIAMTQPAAFVMAAGNDETSDYTHGAVAAGGTSAALLGPEELLTVSKHREKLTQRER